MKRSIVIYTIKLLIVLLVQVKAFGETKRCLFIGDSYFSHNDLSKEFLAIWNEEIADTLLITTQNRNGATITSQWENNSDELLALFASQKWDYVIIEFPRLATPQNSRLIQILHEVDSVLKNCRILCITMDFCISFPEMACAKSAIEGILCNEYMNCEEKLVYVKKISDSIMSESFKNSFEIIPFCHYKYYLYDKYSIELGSDDDFGHPSPFSQAVLARFILFIIINNNSELDTNKTKIGASNDFNITSFYNTFYNENRK